MYVAYHARGKVLEGGGRYALARASVSPSCGPSVQAQAIAKLISA